MPSPHLLHIANHSRAQLQAMLDLAPSHRHAPDAQTWLSTTLLYPPMPYLRSASLRGITQPFTAAPNFGVLVP